MANNSATDNFCMKKCLRKSKLLGVSYLLPLPDEIFAARDAFLYF